MVMVDVVSRDVNFVFFPKIDYRFEKIDFDYQIWMSLSCYTMGVFLAAYRWANANGSSLLAWSKGQQPSGALPHS